MSGEDLRPGSVKRGTGPTLYFSPEPSEATVTSICPGVLPFLPGTTMSVGTRKTSPSGVSKRVFFIRRTGAAEYMLYTVIEPLAFEGGMVVVPCAWTTSESSISRVCIVYARVPVAAVSAGYATNCDVSPKTTVCDLGITVTVVLRNASNANPATTTTAIDATAQRIHRLPLLGRVLALAGAPLPSIGILARFLADAEMLRMPFGADISSFPSACGSSSCSLMLRNGILRGSPSSGGV